MMRVQVDAPRCVRFRLVAWACRRLGLSRRWEASGRDAEQLLKSLVMLGWRRGFIVKVDDNDALTLRFADQLPHVVTSL
jgi:hypothetical protein